MFSFYADSDEQKGFILVTILFFLLIMSLMVLTLLNSAHLELRMSQNYAMASQQFRAAEAGLKIAEEKLSTLVNENTFHASFDYAGYEVVYDIQRFSSRFCLEKQIAYYYRITAQAKQAQGRRVILQTTYAKRLNEVCSGKEEKLTKEGRTSWRELSKY